MALTLNATNKTLELTTGNAVNTDWVVSWVDATTSSFTPGDDQGTVSTATTTTIVSAPAASTQRGVKSISIYNRGASQQVVTIKKDVAATEYTFFKAILESNESVQWTDGAEWHVFDALGRIKTGIAQQELVIAPRPIFYYKAGTASDAAAYWYAFWKDGGFPGAWSPGTPGVNGRNTSGTAAADAGCIPLWTPSGSLYLERATASQTAITVPAVFDVLWVNTGLTVTTTTAQTITMPGPLPARDSNGQVSGEGCMIGLVFTTAATNAATISNSTISYTNSLGVSGRTAALIAVAGDMIPATPVIGTTVWFQLAAGDTGVQSIQSITLGTSLVTGAISLIIARPICMFPVIVANQPAEIDFISPGVRLYTDSCLHLFAKTASTTANTINSIFTVAER